MSAYLLIFFSFIFSSSASVLEGQVLSPDYQQNPTEIRWRRIITEHFEIIFPSGIDREAQRVSHLLEKVFPYVCRSMEVLPPRIPLVLQTQSVQSNGFVSLAPRRSEWFMTPAIDPELTNTEWLKTLAIHELRHVVQFEKSRRGFNHFLEIFLGEVGQAVGLLLTLPPWFYEGDAVGIETALTNGGRGRLPLFDRDLRTLLLSGKKWNYDKAHLGSYKDYIPNHYVYGYFYTTWLRIKYGDFFLSKLVNESSQKSWNPLSFYNSVDRLTNQKFETFYESVMRDLFLEWDDRRRQIKLSPKELLSGVDRNGWTNYYYPQEMDDGRILVLKKGLSFIDEFVAFDDKGKEESLFYPGILHNKYPYKLRQGKIAFFENEYDPRWGYRDFSRLKVFDVKMKKIVLDKRKTKGRLAVLDQEGKNIAFIGWDEGQGQTIIVLDQKGNEVRRISYPRERVITSIDWSSLDSLVLVVRDRLDLKSIVDFNIETKQEKILFGPTQTNIGFIAVKNEKIFFESPESGIDNIYLLSPEGPRQLTTSEFGAYAPDLLKGELIYNDYSVDGMNVVRKKSPSLSEERSSGSFYPIFEKFSKSEDFYGLSQQPDDNKDYPIEIYPQFKNALNFHSWVILAPPLTNTISLTGISRDILNKLSLMAGAEYNLNELTTKGFVGATWSHLYPVLDLQAAYGGRQIDEVSSSNKTQDRWEEGSFELGMSIPWRYIQGRFIHRFTSRAFAKVIKVTNKFSDDLTELSNSTLSSPGLEFSFSAFERLSLRDVYPHWGLSFSTKAEEGKDISGKGQQGAYRGVDARIFVPGFFLHHSFFHQFAFENQRPRNYRYASEVLYPRGTSAIFLQEFIKYSGNYLFPLYYPDWNWSRYLYLKRVSINLFYDELNGRQGTNSYRAASTGWEAIFDLNLVRIFLPLSFGIRGSYILDGEQKTSNYELFLNSVVGTF